MRRGLLLPVLALLVAGCASDDPVAQVRNDVEAVVQAANDGDAEGLRDEVEDLLSTLRGQVATGELDRAEAARIREIADRIAANADLVEPTPTPTPTPEETEEPTPTPTPEETEEPTPTPTPEETEEPEETQEPEEPEPEESEVIEVPIGEESPTGSPVTQPVSEPSARRSSSPAPSGSPART